MWPYLHEEKHHLAWNIPADPVDIHVPLPGDPAVRVPAPSF